MANFHSYIATQEVSETVGHLRDTDPDAFMNMIHGYHLLGGSFITHPCDRAIWLESRHAMPYTRRAIGNVVRSGIIKKLRDAGLTVDQYGPDGQRHRIALMNSHVVVFPDGFIYGLKEDPTHWHVLITYITDNKLDGRLQHYRDACRDGDGTFDPYAQLHDLAHFLMLESQIGNAFILFLNQDTGEMRSERITIDRPRAEAVKERVARVVIEEHMPDPLPWHDVDPECNAAAFACPECPGRFVCGRASANKPDIAAIPLKVTCRNCEHFSPGDTPINAGGLCELHTTPLTINQQMAACDSHVFHEDILNACSVTDMARNFNSKELTRLTVKGLEIAAKKKAENPSLSLEAKEVL